MKRSVLAAGAALIVAAAAVVSPAAAQFRDKSGGGGGGAVHFSAPSGGGGGGGAISRGGSAGFMAGGGPGRVVTQSVAPRGATSFAAVPRTSGNVAVQGGTQWSGKQQWSGNWKHKHHRRFFGPAFALSVGAGYYGDYYYNSCWQLQQIWTPSGWAYQRVYVCDDYDYGYYPYGY